MFYIAAVMLAGYLVVNIFVGVFVDCYQVAWSPPPENVARGKEIGR